MKIVALVAFLLTAATASCLGDEVSCPAPAWDYGSGSSGPAHWGDLDYDWKACSAGTMQSPIVTGTLTGDQRMSAIVLGDRTSKLTVRKTSHELKVYTGVADSNKVWVIAYEEQVLRLLQFHFHVPAEHRDGGTPIGEIHFVFRMTSGRLLVLAVWIDEGQENGALQKIIDAKPTASCATGTTASELSIAQLLPSNRNHYARYEGSLTTPPCDENVTWIIELEPIHATKAQVEKLRVGTSANARPTQPLNGRTVRWRQQ